MLIFLFQMLMNAYQIYHAMRMQHVIIQKDLTFVHVIVDIVAMDFLATVRTALK
jgi:hypothetical protein